MTQTLLLIIALLAVSVMAISLYWNNFHTKFASIALFIILANCVYFSLDGVKGWPAEEPREVKGTIASIVIVNPSESFEGAIYVGVFLSEENEWYEYDYPRISPKTFYVKYSNNRAAEFEKAKQDGFTQLNDQLQKAYAQIQDMIKVQERYKAAIDKLREIINTQKEYYTTEAQAELTTDYKRYDGFKKYIEKLQNEIARLTDELNNKSA